MIEKRRMTHHNARHAPKQAGVVSTHYPHRFRFPSPPVGARWIIGVCDCGAESRGLAYELDGMESWREHHPGRMGKRSKPV